MTTPLFARRDQNVHDKPAATYIGQSADTVHIPNVVCDTINGTNLTGQLITSTTTAIITQPWGFANGTEMTTATARNVTAGASSNPIFAATFTRYTTPEIAPAGYSIATNGPVSITGGKLRIAGGALVYSNTNINIAAGVGYVMRLWYTPAYSGIPATTQTILIVFDVLGAQFTIEHQTNGNIILSFTIPQQGRSWRAFTNTAWIPSAGVEYDFMISIPASRSIDIAIDGVPLANSPQSIPINLTNIWIEFGSINASTFSIRCFEMFNYPLGEIMPTAQVPTRPFTVDAHACSRANVLVADVITCGTARCNALICTAVPDADNEVVALKTSSVNANITGDAMVSATFHFTRMGPIIHCALSTSFTVGPDGSGNATAPAGTIPANFRPSTNTYGTMASYDLVANARTINSYVIHANGAISIVWVGPYNASTFYATVIAWERTAGWS